MIPDVLFWFYKDFEICESRLRSLRRLNPSVRVYGLYGGPLSRADEAKRRLWHWLDDFYAFPEEREDRWKRKHGDIVIARWYRDRGHRLDWETIFVFQWDMVLLAPVADLFRSLRPGEILLSGHRPLSEAEAWWGPVKHGNKRKRKNLEAIKSLLADEFGYSGDLSACLFIVVCLPRLFLERYAASGPPECGFIEYKVPTMATVFGIPQCVDHPFRPWWAANPDTRTALPEERTLNAVGKDVSLSVILKEAASSSGQRIFHPVRQPVPEWYFKPWAAGWLWRLHACKEVIQEGLIRFRQPRKRLPVT